MRRGQKGELTRGRAGQRRPSWPPRDWWSCGSPHQPTRQSSAPQQRRELTLRVCVWPPSARGHVVLRARGSCAAGSRITRSYRCMPAASHPRIPSAVERLSFAQSLHPLSRRAGEGCAPHRCSLPPTQAGLGGVPPGDVCERAACASRARLWTHTRSIRHRDTCCLPPRIHPAPRCSLHPGDRWALIPAGPSRCVRATPTE